MRTELLDLQAELIANTDFTKRNHRAQNWR